MGSQKFNDCIYFENVKSEVCGNFQCFVNSPILDVDLCVLHGNSSNILETKLETIQNAFQQYWNELMNVFGNLTKIISSWIKE